MRFLILTQYFPPEAGAAQIRLMALATQLTRHGHEVRVVTAMPNYPRGEIFDGYRGRWVVREELEGIQLMRTWIYPATGRNTLKRLLNYWSFAITSLFGCLQGPRPDYLFVESPPIFLACTAYVCSKLRRVPLILNVSDLWPESVQALGMIRNRSILWLGAKMADFLYRHAYRVSVQTEGLGAHIASRAGADKVMTLFNGVDTEVFHQIRDAKVPWVGPGEAAFLFAGTFGYASDLDSVLEAALILRDRRDIVFLLVGDGPSKTLLVEKTLRLGLENVRFVGVQPPKAMPPIFSVSRAAIAPMRRSELFKATRPSKIFPSMACETPVIFCGEGETAALLEENGCGIVVDPESPTKLAGAVTRLADDPGLAERLGRKGRALVEASYGWDRIVDGWLGQLQARETAARSS